MHIRQRSVGILAVRGYVRDLVCGQRANQVECEIVKTARKAVRKPKLIALNLPRRDRRTKVVQQLNHSINRKRELFFSSSIASVSPDWHQPTYLPSPKQLRFEMLHQNSAKEATAEMCLQSESGTWRFYRPALERWFREPAEVFSFRDWRRKPSRCSPALRGVGACCQTAVLPKELE